MQEIINKINQFDFPDFDFVIGIARGGIIPAALISQKLNLPLKIINVNYRDENHKPKFDKPILQKPDFNVINKRILLVDDVSRTGKTFNTAKEFLKDNIVKTFVINGKADYYLYNEECFKFPWLLK
jgi:xanthine phosphoribosyltransferase